MKEKIIYLIIGVLIGAIIATTGFLIYSKSSLSNNGQPEVIQMQQNEQMGETSSEKNGEPPSKPDGDNGEEPPAKPNEMNNNSNS